MISIYLNQFVFFTLALWERDGVRAMSGLHSLLPLALRERDE